MAGKKLESSSKILSHKAKDFENYFFLYMQVAMFRVMGSFS